MGMTKARVRSPRHSKRPIRLLMTGIVLLPINIKHCDLNRLLSPSLLSLARSSLLLERKKEFVVFLQGRGRSRVDKNNIYPFDGHLAIRLGCKNAWAGAGKAARDGGRAARVLFGSSSVRYMSEHPLDPPLEMEPLPVQPSATGKSPAPRKLAQRDYAVGVCLLLLVVFLWTASNFVTEVRFDSDLESVRLTICMLVHQDLFIGGYGKPFLSVPFHLRCSPLFVHCHTV